MKKTNWRFLVDVLLTITILGIAFIGFLLGFVLLEGPTVSESSKYFLGLHRHQWGDIHLYLGIAFTALAVLHVILGWSWVKGKARQLFQKRWRAALISVPVVALAVLVVVWAFLPKYPELYEGYGKAVGESTTLEGKADPVQILEEGEVLITGQATLAEVEEQTGIPAREISERLGLPPNLPTDETLGQIKKKHPLSVNEVREVVTELSGVEGVVEPSSEEHLPRRHSEEEEQRPTRGRFSESVSGILITGQMTLYEIEAQSGVSARAIADRLGLPAYAPLGARLGRLRRLHYFTLQDVRDVLADLMEDRPKLSRIY